MILTWILISLLLSALFSGTEIAFISASKLVIELKKKKGSRRGKILGAFYDNPSDFLGTMLVGNNIALVTFTVLMAIPLESFIKDYLSIETEVFSLLIQAILVTLVVLIFGEFLPKTLFRLYPDSILYFLAYPLRFIKFILAIPSKLMTKLSTLLLRLIIKGKVEQDEYAFTRLDLENFIKSSRTDSEDEIDTELFEKALYLREVKVKECMVPRPEIESIEISESVVDLVQIFRETNLSRIIVYKEDIDNVLGYVHHQQMLEQPKSIRKLILDIPIVPEVMRVKGLLNYFIKNKINIAWVVDEFGGTAGIITLEDILEEIFGEIDDEHDQEDHIEQQISDDEFIFSGRLELDYLNEKYPILSLPEDEKFHTLSGYIVMTTEKIPEQGAEIELGGFKFILELVSDTKIETIRMIKIHPQEEVD
ncbi:MAG: hemolysin family protein [Bacteroidetes bacterium]|jgi:CBS domain containing-hemolysin-like protein|nr:hemolysin family protein [Bacteroidota bacterium]MDF1863280.1 hemolysin family protein [Saprospiraceae bacterium]